jgi:transcriptional regulator with XRE-family HTH domain
METTKTKHIGRNIARLRELRGMKQLALAEAIGVSQQTISHIETSETVEEEKLQLVAKALDVSVEAIKNFSEENVINYFNSFHNNVVTTGSIFASNCTFNPLDKLMEVVDENKALYQQLLQAEKDKVGYLEKLLDKK